MHVAPETLNHLRQLGPVAARRVLGERFRLPTDVTLDLTDKVDTPDPHAALQEAFGRAADVCEYLEFMIEAEGTVTRTVTGSRGERRQVPTMYVELLGQWTDRQLRLVGQALRTGVVERRPLGPARPMSDDDLREAVDVFVAAIQKVAPHIDSAHVRAVVSNELRQLGADAAA